jgi:hypothetical protein
MRTNLDNYLTPTIQQVKNRFIEMNYKHDFDHQVVQDLSNMVASKLYCGDSKQAIVTNDAGLEKLANIVNETDLKGLSGSTPLEKATALFSILVNPEKASEGTKPKKEVAKEDAEGIDSELERFPFQWVLGNGSGKLSEGLKEILKKLLFTIIDDINEVLHRKDVIRDYFHQDIQEREVMNLPPERVKLLEKIAILETRGKIKSKHQTNLLKQEQMQEYSQVGRMASMSNMLMPTFAYKFATKQLTVNEKKLADKQVLFVMLDDSGSMSNYEKLQWVEAIIRNRCFEIKRTKCELHICKFESEIYSMQQIKTMEEGIHFLRNYSPHGGGTDVACCISQLEKYIEAHFKKCKPQILIVNDGQDHIDAGFKPKYETHSLMLLQGNTNLQQVIEHSGGHFEILS